MIVEKGQVNSKYDILNTLFCLEILGRSGIENTEDAIERGINWILQKQNDIGMWDDEGFPFPFMTVIVLEYFQNKDYFFRKLSLYLDDLTPDNVILHGMERAIEISMSCISENERISPKVGATIIKDNQIIVEAYRGELGPGDHAEYTALVRKKNDYEFQDSIIITTLEPCTSRRQFLNLYQFLL